MDKQLMSDCVLCPRQCHANRLKGHTGRCGMTGELVVARAALHYWEEPCISGEAGSGTVFFAGCGLGCVYCQNADISKGLAGKNISIERLAQIFTELEAKSAQNINLVTPTHYVPQIIEAIEMARRMGMELPIVYNSSGYERIETLRLLDGIVDIYLPDMKYMDRHIAGMYSDCRDYFTYASKAVEEMVRQTGQLMLDPSGIMRKGVIVRHLALPGHAEDSKNIIRYLHETYEDRIYISIMNQYTPMPQSAEYPGLNRKLTIEEYDELVDYAIGLGVEKGFIQEGDTASESFIPEFENEGV